MTRHSQVSAALQPALPNAINVKSNIDLHSTSSSSSPSTSTGTSISNSPSLGLGSTTGSTTTSPPGSSLISTHKPPETVVSLSGHVLVDMQVPRGPRYVMGFDQ